MMLCLIVNVCDRPFNIPNADAERSITFLPGEATMPEKCIVYPF